MGRMKEICIEIMEANNGIPEGMTIADVVRMKEMEIYNWEEYERKKKGLRLQSFKQENPGETGKVQQAEQRFRTDLEETKKKNK